MNKYNVIDEAIINAPVGDVYNAVLACYNGTNNWWKPYLVSKIIHAESVSESGAVCIVTVNEMIAIRFVTKTMEVKENKSIRLQYPKGAFTGEGIWEFEAQGNQTKIRFVWKTNPSGILMNIVSLFTSLDKKHSHVMQKGFENLKKFLQ